MGVDATYLPKSYFDTKGQLAVGAAAAQTVEAAVKAEVQQLPPADQSIFLSDVQNSTALAPNADGSPPADIAGTLTKFAQAADELAEVKAFFAQAQSPDDLLKTVIASSYLEQKQAVQQQINFSQQAVSMFLDAADKETQGAQRLRDSAVTNFALQVVGSIGEMIGGMVQIYGGLSELGELSELEIPGESGEGGDGEAEGTPLTNGNAPSEAELMQADPDGEPITVSNESELSGSADARLVELDNEDGGAETSGVRIGGDEDGIASADGTEEEDLVSGSDATEESDDIDEMDGATSASESDAADDTEESDEADLGESEADADENNPVADLEQAGDALEEFKAKQDDFRLKMHKIEAKGRVVQGLAQVIVAASNIYKQAGNLVAAEGQADNQNLQAQANRDNAWTQIATQNYNIAVGLLQGVLTFVDASQQSLKQIQQAKNDMARAIGQAAWRVR